MQGRQHESKVEDFPVPLDRDTRDRLEFFARMCENKDPGQVAAALLRDLLADEDFWQAAADEGGRPN